METLSKDLDKLTEVDTLICDVVEYRLELIALILHIANLHIKTHLGSYLTRCNHSLMLKGYSLLPALNIIRSRLTENLLKLTIIWVEAHTTHLLSHHIARKRDDTNIVTWLRLYSNDIATLKVQVIDILIV